MTLEATTTKVIHLLAGWASAVEPYGHRSGHRGAIADLWNHSGLNAPESNIWSGALL